MELEGNEGIRKTAGFVGILIEEDDWIMDSILVKCGDLLFKEEDCWV